jgi:signal transduction histidine kinase
MQKAQMIASLQNEVMLKVKEADIEQLENSRQQDRIKIWALAIVVTLLFIAAWVWFRKFKLRQRLNRELSDNNTVLQNTLIELSRTQQQLVHSEKLASLGKLTAGIAHEIKNPLNFINNFSSLSAEIINELPNATTQEEREAIYQTLKDNLVKIESHGKRADRIVQSMLLHSRHAGGMTTETNFAKFVSDYCDLAYEGIKANYKDFKCQLVKNLDSDVSPLKIVPQDMSRVILNIVNNALYAAYFKSKNTDDAFQPKVEIMLSQLQDTVNLLVTDNGAGIPTELQSKIFEPFFTTKAAGSGTGLGLSISYDIVKAHGGTIEFSSTIMYGTQFIIGLKHADLQHEGGTAI